MMKPPSQALIQETYPSGRVVKNEFEPDGDLAKVISRKLGNPEPRENADNILSMKLFDIYAILCYFGESVI